MSAGMRLRISHETGKLVKYVIGEDGKMQYAPTRPFRSLINRAPVPADCTEYFTVAQVAAMLKVSIDTVRRRFKHRPDVAKVQRAKVKGQRVYNVLRIPKAAIEAYVAGK
jgi:Helix-turn-helix domain